MAENASTAGTAPKQGGKGLNVGIVAAAVVTVAAIALWVVQLSGGLVQTNMRNLDNWGLYIMGFMWFVGLSAGGLIVSSVPRVLGMEGFGGISKIAIWTSIAATCCAVGLIVVDLGNPLRIWELFISSNLMSPLMWDVLVITTYLILSVVYLALTLRNEVGKLSDGTLRVFSVVCLVIAVMVHTVTAWIIGVQPSHELWNTALMGPWFVCSALVSGTALVLVVCVALRKVGYLDMDKANLDKMAKWLGAFCIVDLYFFGCDLLTSGWAGGEGAEVVAMLISGVLAPFFWSQTICCAIAAAVCFVPKLRSVPLMTVAGVLGMVAIFCKRFQLIAGGFQIPNVGMAGIVTEYTATGVSGADTTMSAIYSGLVYAPAVMEVGLFAGMIAMGVLIFLLGVKFIDLKPNERSH
ncbi:MAG: polysulfide reductase NrfD [Coriobacteriales bacterium]|jgi:molybdopterin-containing oxidoreductase family membrane subunit|nr:polysulfide reductase NrfD [Coriobacteriales bacterium]